MLGVLILVETYISMQCNKREYTYRTNYERVVSSVFYMLLFNCLIKDYYMTILFIKNVISSGFYVVEIESAY